MGKDERTKLDKEAESEYEFVFGHKYGSINLNAASCAEVIYAVWSIIRWRFDRRRHLTHREVLEVMDLASNPTDNLRTLVYAAKHDAEEWRRLWWCIRRAQNRIDRRWYQHPKWHIHHWKIQIHFWQKLRRWVLTRCAGCGKRFPFGYCPVRRGWGAPRIKWFQGEVGLYHHNKECRSK